MQVQWKEDAARTTDRYNQEFVRIKNRGTKAIDVSRWTIRMGGFHTLRVPSGERVASKRTLTIHVGEGRDRRYHRFLGLSRFLLTNTNLDGGPHRGNGVYLLDPDGDLRAYQTWPCVRTCDDPTGGAIVIQDVSYDPDGYDAEHVNGEWVSFKNVGEEPVRTGNLVFENSPYVYELPVGHVLDPGETLRIRAGKGADTHNVRYLGSDKPIMVNTGDRVFVRTFNGIVIDCVAWGSASCPQ